MLIFPKVIACCVIDFLEMPWSVVQIKKKKGRKYQKVIEAVPDTWIKNGFVYWPSHNQITLQRDEFSKIDHENWTPYECVVFVSGYLDFDTADRKVNDYKPTVSDVEHTKKKNEMIYTIDDGTGLNALPISDLPVSASFLPIQSNSINAMKHFSKLVRQRPISPIKRILE